MTSLTVDLEQQRTLYWHRRASQGKIIEELDTVCARQSASKRPLAIFTHVRNEKRMLPIWLGHYVKQVRKKIPIHSYLDSLHYNLSGSRRFYFCY